MFKLFRKEAVLSAKDQSVNIIDELKAQMKRLENLNLDMNTELAIHSEEISLQEDNIKTAKSKAIETIEALEAKLLQDVADVKKRNKKFEFETNTKIENIKEEILETERTIESNNSVVEKLKLLFS